MFMRNRWLHRNIILLLPDVRLLHVCVAGCMLSVYVGVLGIEANVLGKCQDMLMGGNPG